jgi:ribosome maturation factor RimP
VDKDGLITLLEPEVHALGFELVDLEFRSGGIGLLRVYIDRAEGVTVDDCAEVSNQISALLDVEDPIPGSFTLEVSSPGLDRRLRTAEHFARFIGREARVHTRLPVDGRKRFRGELKALDGDVVVMMVDGEEVRLPMDKIHSARLVPEL